jgi:hypothetical protein
LQLLFFHFVVDQYYGGKDRTDHLVCVGPSNDTRITGGSSMTAWGELCRVRDRTLSDSGTLFATNLHNTHRGHAAKDARAITVPFAFTSWAVRT